LLDLAILVARVAKSASQSAYFVVHRPALLARDLRYIWHVDDAARGLKPQLSWWLTQVIRVMAGTLPQRVCCRNPRCSGSRMTARRRTPS
jgi:hypothetical protein